MHPMIRRQQAVEATVQRFAGKTLAYGRDDCARMAAFLVKRLGVKVRLAKMPRYSSEVGAARALKALECDTLAEVVDLTGLPRIAPARAIIGDLAAYPGEDGGVAIFVVVAAGRVLGCVDGVFAIGEPQQAAITAWRTV